MASPPAKNELSDTYPNPSNAVMRAGMGKLWDYATGLLGLTGDAAEARTALGVPAIGDVIGRTQAWTNVKASRAVNTNYTNSTGKPIMASVAILSSANFSLTAYVDGVIVGSASNVSGFPSCLSFIVPPGAAYQIQVSAGTPTVSAWTELR